MEETNQHSQQTGASSSGDAGGKRPSLWSAIIIGLLLTFGLNYLMVSMTAQAKTQVQYDQFVKLLEAGNVKQVEIGVDELSFTLKDTVRVDDVRGILALPVPASDASKGKNLSPAAQKREEKLIQREQQAEQNLVQRGIFYTGLVNDPDLTNRLIQYDVDFYKPITRSNPLLQFISSWILPFVIIYGLYFLFMRSMAKRMGGEGAMGGLGGIMNIGKSRAKQYDMQKRTGITFADVAGEEEAKESLQELVDFLHHPEKYREIGAKQPKGALLVGPPGTGKTLLAKAVAGEANVPFFSLSGSEFVEMFVGVGASRVRDLFSEAQKHAPCIIFIDEIDAIGKSRDNAMMSNDEREQTLNQLLSEMDGFDSSKAILVLAATNRPEVLDKALLRPGRFDRRVIVERPDLPGREAILKVHAKKVRLDTDVDLHEIALATSGAAGADLANMVNEAALRAVRMGRDKVKQEDLMDAVEVVIAGKEKKDRILSPKEKKMVAYHEVGHALASALQKNEAGEPLAAPVQKITIVPRTMGALGYTMNMPEEERYLLTKSELLAQIVTLLAGRCAEEIEFNEASTGASNDFERATKLARQMVTQYGMSDKFGVMVLENQQNQYLDGRNVFTGSEQSSAGVDAEVEHILTGCHEKAIAILKDKKDKLAEIANYLFEKETITGAKFLELLEA
ncbi:MAG: ATP-dependent zinc metalloprotease FtsH [Spirochaetaceae bacterium]|jgi:cell division protease FtsH|nr:ATP-dependent zinc metalloprotease FtsH [Spirochaetaceae bacterium]